LNLQQDPEGPYDACPYCLTEIPVEEEQTFNVEPETLEPEVFEPDTVESEMLEPEETSVEAEPEVEEAVSVEEKAEVGEAPSGCAHYLGYLSEKASSDKIPDECMMCQDIVTCMLKKMKA
jgi:hypothetical protein